MANAQVIGVVTAISDDRDAKIVIVEERNGQYTNEVAVRFWGDKALPLIKGLGVGQRVFIGGYVKSRKGGQGDRFFTEFSGAQVIIEGASLPFDRAPGEDDI